MAEEQDQINYALDSMKKEEELNRQKREMLKGSMGKDLKRQIDDKKKTKGIV